MAWKHLFKHHSKAGNGFSSPAKAAAELKRQIDVAIREIAFPTGLGAAASSKIVTDGIIHKIEAGSFDRHNQSGIVEVNADFTATRADGSQVFHLRVKWDADNPREGSEETAHYGWEIYLDGQRVKGPGHVFFDSKTSLPHYRVADINMIEEKSLEMKRSSTIGLGKMACKTVYYRLERPVKT